MAGVDSSGEFRNWNNKNRTSKGQDVLVVDLLWEVQGSSRGRVEPRRERRPRHSRKVWAGKAGEGQEEPGVDGGTRVRVL